MIEGEGAIEGDEFNEHCEEVLEAISNFSPQKYAIFKPARSVSGKLSGTQNGDRGNGRG